MNLMEFAEKVFRERSLLDRIDTLLANKYIRHLGKGQIHRLRGLYLEHLRLMALAMDRWGGDINLLEECLGHIQRTGGIPPRHHEDLGLVREVEKTLNGVRVLSLIFSSVDAAEDPDFIDLNCDAAAETGPEDLFPLEEEDP